MSKELTQKVFTEISKVKDPELHRTLTELNMISECEVINNEANITVKLTIAECPAANKIRKDIQTHAEKIPEITKVNIKTDVMSVEERKKLVSKIRGNKTKNGIINQLNYIKTYAISSGKGGVGKSTITANLAVALSELGQKVALIDADIHGFSQPEIFGMKDENNNYVKPTRVGDLIIAPSASGIKIISIGMFLPDNNAGAISWRGPMLHRSIEQFLNDIYFGDIDVLLIDLPPGTGDIAISLGQMLPSAEIIVVTTPQSNAAEIAKRSGIVAGQTGQKVIGVIENMSYYLNEDGKKIHLFGSGGGKKLSDALNRYYSGENDYSGKRECATTPAGVEKPSSGEREGATTPAGAEKPSSAKQNNTHQPVELLGQIPLENEISEQGDAGVPYVLAYPSSASSQEIYRIAQKLVARPRNIANKNLPVNIK